MADWRPHIDRDVLIQRAAILAKIRGYFQARDVLEVETPVLGAHGVTDPNLQAFTAEHRYLQTSPEYFLKRLLAAGSGDIFQIGRVFRREESGRLHHHEFTLLEWYRQAFDDRQLAEEVLDLIQYLQPSSKKLDVQSMSYAAALATIDVDMFNEDIDGYRVSMENAGIAVSGEFSLAEWRELVFSELVQQKFPDNRLTVIVDYPADCAALARLKRTDERVACRFEVFRGNVELANGYYELRDRVVQEQRFVADNETRKAKGLSAIPLDDEFLAALDFGLPECAGVALGLDRLIMKILGKDCISAVNAFSE